MLLRDRTKIPLELARSNHNVEDCRSSQTHAPASNEWNAPRGYTRSRSIDADNVETIRLPETTRPVFGRPSTPNRRVILSFDISSSPFTLYSHENSPFLQLAKNWGPASKLVESQTSRRAGPMRKKEWNRLDSR